MPCLLHLQCSCCHVEGKWRGATGSRLSVFHTRRPFGAPAGTFPGDGRARQGFVAVTAAQTVVPEPLPTSSPKRPRHAASPATNYARELAKPGVPERPQKKLPPAPEYSKADRAPPPQEHVYWRGSATSRSAVLGRRLLSLGRRDGIASVLQGQMLSSKEITRWSPFLPGVSSDDRKHLSVHSPAQDHFSPSDSPGAALSSWMWQAFLGCSLSINKKCVLPSVNNICVGSR